MYVCMYMIVHSFKDWQVWVLFKKLLSKGIIQEAVRL